MNRYLKVIISILAVELLADAIIIYLGLHGLYRTSPDESWYRNYYRRLAKDVG